VWEGRGEGGDRGLQFRQTGVGGMGPTQKDHFMIILLHFGRHFTVCNITAASDKIRHWITLLVKPLGRGDPADTHPRGVGVPQGGGPGDAI